MKKGERERLLRLAGAEGKKAAKRKRRGPEPQEPMKPEPPAGAAAEKRAVLERLAEYRRARGRGSMRALAKASGVRESVLWDMLECAVVPLEAWRAVGGALERIEGLKEGVK